MAETVEIPSLEQATKDFFDIGNWPMSTLSVFLAANISSFYLVRLFMDVNHRFSFPFATVLAFIVVGFTFTHYRLMTLRIKYRPLILVVTIALLTTAMLWAARLGRIL